MKQVLRRTKCCSKCNEHGQCCTCCAAGVSRTPIGVEATLAMLAQVLARLLVAVSLLIAPIIDDVEQVVQDEEDAPVARNPSYLKVMDHTQKLRTKVFLGCSKPVEANQWIIRLEKNFNSICCHVIYKKDITLHYHDGDVHIWCNEWQLGLVSFTVLG
ncbi:hypothetical protein Bca101_018346 [Brassica carinata]